MFVSFFMYVAKDSAIICTCLNVFREFLWKFFYPPDFQPIEATPLPQPGQWRKWKSFDFKMSMQNDVTIDILFTKNKVAVFEMFALQCVLLCRHKIVYILE